MSFQEAAKLQEPKIFSFPAIYDGVSVKITVSKENDQFLVLIDDVVTARIAPDEDDDTWHLIKGYLDDNDLVQEIGARIEARHKHFASL